jgi:hypothetical protein
VGRHLVGLGDLSLAEFPHPDSIGANAPGIVLDAAHGKVPPTLGAELENSQDAASFWYPVQKENSLGFWLWRERFGRGCLVVKLASPECGFLKWSAATRSQQDEDKKEDDRTDSCQRGKVPRIVSAMVYGCVHGAFAAF